MKNTLYKLVMMATVAFTAIAAEAQLAVDVPFSFEVGGVVCPAGDFGILEWPTSAVCFGPPRVKRTSSLDLSDELGSGGGVGLESQGGVI